MPKVKHRPSKTLCQALLLSCLVFFLACESKQKKQAAPAPRTTIEKTAPVNDAKAPSAATKAPRGSVVFSVQNADLKTVVLPLFQSQAGITVIWRDEARKVSLSFIEPVPWRSALDLLCRFYDLEYRQEGTRILLFKRGDSVSAFNFNSKKTSDSGGIKSSISANARPTSSGSSSSSGSAQSASSSSNTNGAKNLKTGLNNVGNAIDRRTKKRQ